MSVEPDEVDHRRVYAGHADDYERLVAAEDADGRLLPALAALVPLAGARVLEIGVGTGRVTELLVGAGARVVGCEPAAAMLEVARRKLERFGNHGCELHPLTVQQFTAPGTDFNLAIAGWVLLPHELSELSVITAGGQSGAFTLCLLGVSLRPGGQARPRVLARVPVSFD